MTPVDLFQKIKTHCRKEYKIVLISTFLFGLAAHAYKFLNILPNYDSLESLYYSQNTIHLGRCFLVLGCGISSFWDLPWVIGLLSLLYLALSTICITEILQIKSTPSLILASGLIVTFPAVTNTFTFLFTADGYFLAMFLAMLAILLSLRSRKGILPAALCICFSFGMYQSYVLMAIALTLLYTAKSILIDQKTIKDLWKPLAQVFTAGLSGTVLYFISYQLLLKIENVSLSNYQGMSNISLHTLPNPLDAAYNSLHDFLFFFFYSEKGLSLYTILNAVMFMTLACAVLLFCFRSLKRIGVGRIALSLLCLALMPFIIYFYYFISDVNYHTIMLESMVLIFLMLILLLENAPQLPKLSVFVQWLCTLLSALMIYNFILLSNIVYTGMHNSYERSMAVINRIADRMEQLPDFPQADKLAVIGDLPDSRETIHNYPPDLSGTVPNYVMRIQPNYVDMLRNYNNIILEEAPDDKIDRILKTEQYHAMNIWPAAGSVAIIDDTVVVKFSEP
ncbi:MAG: hypothetical protein GX234_06225 [Clostridiales bacterium]|nr:hypothetical protein [Clostridiales bacterium]